MMSPGVYPSLLMRMKTPFLDLKKQARIIKHWAAGKLESIAQPMGSIHTFKVMHPGSGRKEGAWAGARTGGNWLVSVAMVETCCLGRLSCRQVTETCGFENKV